MNTDSSVLPAALSDIPTDELRQVNCYAFHIVQRKWLIYDPLRRMDEQSPREEWRDLPTITYDEWQASKEVKQ